jgi:hypothetical protein
VPDTLKITFPLMALVASNRCLALSWERRPELSALFDSPDRIFHSHGHVMGIIAPGSDGVTREEGRLLPYEGFQLRPGNPLKSRLWLTGVRGHSVIPAVQQYVRHHGLPPLPEVDVESFSRLAARGWLDSRIRENNLYRHAFWPGFNPAPAADAAVWMDWLADSVPRDIAARLRDAAQQARQPIPVGDLNARAVGHIRFPLPALVYGGVLENARAAADEAMALLRRFDHSGAIRYLPEPGKPDYSKTHWTNEANGLTAQVVVRLLETAAFSGESTLIESAVERLESLSKFDHTVPRGAQTWEVPLHTPDILASAHLVRAFTLGYELTGRADFLDRAEAWAWTGIPFVYLSAPTPEPVGNYSTIAVFGATSWESPVWFGQPVQWCGLVYADALRNLAAYRSAGPWRQVARGIASAGVQHTWDVNDPERQGLLPDFYMLRSQARDGPAINPATVLSQVAFMEPDRQPFQFRALPESGFRVFAAGTIEPLEARRNRLRMRVQSWPLNGAFVYVNGFDHQPELKIDHRTVRWAEPHAWDPAGRRAVVRVGRDTVIEFK